MAHPGLDKVFTSLSAHCRYGQLVSAQRERSAVAAAHRSILPNVAGVPWWGALLIATSATVIGYGIDAGQKELTHVFAACYIAGCVIAVLAVRQSGVFTAVIQPPLILFCAVPGAYWLFHGGKIDKLKDLLINCGYPLIERFPLMLGTAGVVLLIGLVRWYFGMTHRPAGDADGKADTTIRPESKPLLGGIVAKLASFVNGSDDDEDGADEAPSTRPRTARRSARTSPRTGRAARSNRGAQRTDRSRSRHSRAGQEDQNDPAAERRQRRRAQQRPRDFDAADPPRRSRRPRPQGEPDPPDRRSQPPREARRDSYGRRGSYERPPSRRFDPYESYEPQPEQFSRYEKPYESYEQPRRRATPAGPQGTNPTHHPISQVRYRGSVPPDERPDDPRAGRRGRPRAPRRHQAESWEYDF